MEFKDRLNQALLMKGISAAELSRISGVNEGAISQYRKGGYKANQYNLEKIASALNVSIPWLMGATENMSIAISDLTPEALIARFKKVPMLGHTAAGEPMFCDECAEGFIDVLDKYDVDFCLTVKGNSMIGIGINDGDIVFVKKQAIVDNGEVAVVRINGDNVTLKRFYKEGDEIKLVSENPKCKTMVFTSQNCDDFIVLGKAVIKQSEII